MTERQYHIVHYNQYHYIHSTQSYKVIAHNQESGRTWWWARYRAQDSGITECPNCGDARSSSAAEKTRCELSRRVFC